jgi:hypothetical protein
MTMPENFAPSGAGGIVTNTRGQLYNTNCSCTICRERAAVDQPLPEILVDVNMVETLMDALRDADRASQELNDAVDPPLRTTTQVRDVSDLNPGDTLRWGGFDLTVTALRTYGDIIDVHVAELSMPIPYNVGKKVRRKARVGLVVAA